MRFNKRRLLLVGNTLFIAFGEDRFRRDAIHADAVRAGLRLDSPTYLEVRSHLLTLREVEIDPHLRAGQALTRIPSCFLTARRMSAEPEASTSRMARDRAKPPTIAANMRTARS
jgi:hypothetical protein